MTLGRCLGESLCLMMLKGSIRSIDGDVRYRDIRQIRHLD